MKEVEEPVFPIRAYTKAELAMLYCPQQCISVALQTLYRWIRMNRLLMAELEAVGYNKFRHCYTPAEVRLIVKYLGEPGC